MVDSTSRRWHLLTHPIFVDLSLLDAGVCTLFNRRLMFSSELFIKTPGEDSRGGSEYGADQLRRLLAQFYNTRRTQRPVGQSAGSLAVLPLSRLAIVLPKTVEGPRKIDVSSCLSCYVGSYYRYIQSPARCAGRLPGFTILFPCLPRRDAFSLDKENETEITSCIEEGTMYG